MKCARSLAWSHGSENIAYTYASGVIIWNIMNLASYLQQAHEVGEEKKRKGRAPMKCTYILYENPINLFRPTYFIRLKISHLWFQFAFTSASDWKRLWAAAASAAAVITAITLCSHFKSWTQSNIIQIFKMRKTCNTVHYSHKQLHDGSFCHHFHLSVAARKIAFSQKLYRI